MSSFQADLALVPQWVWASMLFVLILGVYLGRLIWGRAAAQVPVLRTELLAERRSAEAAAAERAGLQRQLAVSQDQIRPLADEVERLRRENARLARAVPSPASGDAGLDPPPSPVAPMGTTTTADLEDLRLLKGVGDKMIARLEAHGIRSNRDLARLHPGEAAQIDGDLGPLSGRIARDRLIEQAILLVEGRVAEFEARFGKLERV
jgi:predicted flap endonuclease-1-like 5' DNA nuclease